MEATQVFVLKYFFWNVLERENGPIRVLGFFLLLFFSYFKFFLLVHILVNANEMFMMLMT